MIVARGIVARGPARAPCPVLPDDVGAEAASRLEKLVAHLPSVEPLDQEEADGLGAVVSRIVGRD